MTLETEVEGAVGGEGKPHPCKLPFPPSNASIFLEPAQFSHAFFHMTSFPVRNESLPFLPLHHLKGPTLGSKILTRAESQHTL